MNYFPKISISITLLSLLTLYINPTLLIYFLQIGQGQLVRFRSLISFKILAESQLPSWTNSHSLEPKHFKVSYPLNTVFTIGKLMSDGFLKL